MKHNLRKIIAKRLISLLIFIATLNVSYAQGYISETIQQDGLIREYSIYVPASYDELQIFLCYLIYMEVVAILLLKLL